MKMLGQSLVALRETFHRLELHTRTRHRYFPCLHEGAPGGGTIQLGDDEAPDAQPSSGVNCGEDPVQAGAQRCRRTGGYGAIADLSGALELELYADFLT